MPRIPDYELLRRIGQGSYGEVWLARGVTGLYRAIKIVSRARFADSLPFERELRGLTEFSAAATGSPGELALLHVGRNDAEGYFYYVMELADDAETGRTVDPARYVPLTLAELLRRRGRVPAGEAVDLVLGIAHGLATLHRRGLVHRDLKPSNIVLVNGVPKLADIGLVTPAAPACTFVGTEEYMPPEGPGAATADVFAAGMLLYELSTGLDPRQFPLLPADVDTREDRRELMQVNQIVLRACEPDPSRRYSNGDDLGRALAALTKAPAAPRWRTVRLPVAGASVLVAVSVGLAGWWWQRERSRTAPVEVVAGRSAPTADASALVVLPFVNLSPEPVDALLAEGIHENVIRRLNEVRELHVVSRASAIAVRDLGQPNAELARRLHVRYVAEGAVRRLGDRLQVTGRLRDARDDRQLWTETYEREITDIFVIEALWSDAIARSLVPDPASGRAPVVQRRPTESMAAYQAYLKGRAAMDWFPIADAAPEVFLEEAVKADPGFVAAWCALTEAHAWAVFSTSDTTPGRRAKADDALEHVRRLAPGTPELLRTEAIHAYHVRRDYDHALKQFERLRLLQPNDAAVYFWLGRVLARQCRWADSLACSRRAVELEPANPQYSYTYRVALACARRWKELSQEQRRVCSLWPGKLTHPPRVSGAFADELNLATVESWVERSPAPLQALIERCPVGQRDVPAIVYARMQLAWLRRDLVAFRELERSLPKLGKADSDEAIQSNLRFAMYYRALGDRESEHANLRDTADLLRAQVRRDPTSAVAWSRLGQAEALLGNRERAREAANRSVQLVPESVDAGVGAYLSAQMAVTYAWLGEKDLAVAELARLINNPMIGIGGVELRTDPEYEPLRGDPRFEALANDSKNDEPLF